jgi:hypothetical protein
VVVTVYSRLFTSYCSSIILQGSIFLVHGIAKRATGLTEKVKHGLWLNEHNICLNLREFILHANNSVWTRNFREKIPWYKKNPRNIS